jgi:hypothetical protein
MGSALEGILKLTKRAINVGSALEGILKLTKRAINVGSAPEGILKLTKRAINVGSAPEPIPISNKIRRYKNLYIKKYYYLLKIVI